MLPSICLSSSPFIFIPPPPRPTSSQPPEGRTKLQRGTIESFTLENIGGFEILMATISTVGTGWSSSPKSSGPEAAARTRRAVIRHSKWFQLPPRNLTSTRLQADDCSGEIGARVSDWYLNPPPHQNRHCRNITQSIPLPLGWNFRNITGEIQAGVFLVSVSPRLLPFSASLIQEKHSERKRRGRV